jgi:colanic acid biosynthesis glycosyl transferase WcaI
VKNKSVYILGINFKPELTGISNYTSEMCQWLVENQIKCTVITAYPHYPEWNIFSSHKKNSLLFSKEKDSSGYLTIYRCPILIYGKTNGLSRIITEISFFLSSALMLFYLLFKSKPNFIWTVSPSQISVMNAIVFSKLKNIPIYLHLQDLQFDAAIQLGIIKNHFIKSIVKKLDKIILNNASSISTISEKMAEKLKLKTKNEIAIFRNWVNTMDFYPLENNKKMEVKISHNLPKDSIIIMYSGSLGEKQGIDIMLEVAKHFQTNKEIIFIISSTGPYWEKLKSDAEKEHLSNIVFKKLSPKNQLNEFLNIADIHLVLQKEEATDLVLPSKILPILSIDGFLIIQSTENSELYSMLHQKMKGSIIEPNNPEKLIETIQLILQQIELPNNHNNRNLAKLHFEKDKILQDYFSKKFLIS